MYFYEPCRALDWGSETTGSQADRVRAECEELTVRLLSCNATESDLRTLLGDWRAAKRDGALLRVAAKAGSLRCVGMKLRETLQPQLGQASA